MTPAARDQLRRDYAAALTTAVDSQMQASMQAQDLIQLDDITSGAADLDRAIQAYQHDRGFRPPGTQWEPPVRSSWQASRYGEEGYGEEEYGGKRPRQLGNEASVPNVVKLLQEMDQLRQVRQAAPAGRLGPQLHDNAARLLASLRTHKHQVERLPVIVDASEVHRTKQAFDQAQLALQSDAAPRRVGLPMQAGRPQPTADLMEQLFRSARPNFPPGLGEAIQNGAPEQPLSQAATALQAMEEWARRQDAEAMKAITNERNEALQTAMMQAVSGMAAMTSDPAAGSLTAALRACSEAIRAERECLRGDDALAEFGRTVGPQLCNAGQALVAFARNYHQASQIRRHELEQWQQELARIQPWLNTRPSKDACVSALEAVKQARRILTERRRTVEDLEFENRPEDHN